MHILKLAYTRHGFYGGLCRRPRHDRRRRRCLMVDFSLMI